MQTKLRRLLWLWLCLGVLLTLSSFACRRSAPETRRTPHRLESEVDALVVDDTKTAKLATAELTDDTLPTSAEPSHASPSRSPRVVPKTKTTRVTETSPPAGPSERAVDPSPSNEPSNEASPPPPAPPPPPRLPLPSPEQRASMQPQPREPWPRSEEPERKKHDLAFDIAVAVGALGVGMGSAAAMTGDGRPGETTFSVVSLGIGAAGFATALVLHATEPPPQKGVRVSVSPAGVNGTF